MPKRNTNPFLFWGGHTRYLHETCPFHTRCHGAENPETAAAPGVGWANSASDIPTQQLLQLPPPAKNVVEVCNHILGKILIFKLFPPPPFSLSPAPSRTGRLPPHSQHSISEVRTRPSTLPCRGSTLFSLTLWDLRIIWRLGSRDGCSGCRPGGCYTQTHFQLAQEAACPQPVAQFATFICG